MVEYWQSIGRCGGLFYSKSAFALFIYYFCKKLLFACQVAFQVEKIGCCIVLLVVQGVPASFGPLLKPIFVHFGPFCCNFWLDLNHFFYQFWTIFRLFFDIFWPFFDIFWPLFDYFWTPFEDYDPEFVGLPCNSTLLTFLGPFWTVFSSFLNHF